METSITFRTPAKINLFLQVTGRRADGYHSLVTVMCPISLYDTLHLAFGGARLRVHCDHSGVPDDEDNLVFKAVRLFCERAGVRTGLQVHIEKKIPVAGGLGGGSSDAGAVLGRLNRFFGRPLSAVQLVEAAAQVGADVPFFISPRPVVATGIGDQLRPFDGLEPYPVVLLKPPISVSTAEIFRNFNLRLTFCRKKDMKFRFEIQKTAAADFCNDLESVAIPRYPEIGAAKRALAAHGARGVLMSGSGPTVFGIFACLRQARNAFDQLSREKRWETFLANLMV